MTQIDKFPFRFILSQICWSVKTKRGQKARKIGKRIEKKKKKSYHIPVIERNDMARFV